MNNKYDKPFKKYEEQEVTNKTTNGNPWNKKEAGDI